MQRYRRLFAKLSTLSCRLHKGSTRTRHEDGLHQKPPPVPRWSWDPKQMDIHDLSQQYAVMAPWSWVQRTGRR
jgi:hypothetical protein